MKSFNSFIFESKYDAFSERIASEVLSLIKRESGTRVLRDLTYELPVAFDLSVEIIRTDKFSTDTIEHFKELPWETVNFKKTGFVVDANTLWISGDADDIPEVELIIVINPLAEPTCYSALNFKLTDTIRHEIEHTLQKGFNRAAGHEVKGRAKNRAQAQTDYRYFLLPEEVMPMISGMRLSSIQKGIPIDQEFEDYLNAFVESGFMTNDQMQFVITKWIQHVLKSFPKTKISNKYSSLVKPGGSH